jgi:uncharacterized membrane protein YbhN (UPF0104 family)
VDSCDLQSNMRTYTTGQDGGGSAGRPAKLYRGSRRRLKRITLRGNWSLELALFLVWLLFCLLVLVPWLVRHPPEHGHQPSESESIQPVR